MLVEIWKHLNKHYKDLGYLFSITIWIDLRWCIPNHLGTRGEFVQEIRAWVGQSTWDIKVKMHAWEPISKTHACQNYDAQEAQRAQEDLVKRPRHIKWTLNSLG